MGAAKRLECECAECREVRLQFRAWAESLSGAHTPREPDDFLRDLWLGALCADAQEEAKATGLWN